MRVLRTEFYPDENEVSKGRQIGGAFAAAWFSIPSNLPVDLRPALSEFKGSSVFIDIYGLPESRKVEYTYHLSARFIELSLRQSSNTAGRSALMNAVKENRLISTDFSPIHLSQVESILHDGVVIERSPPEAIPLQHLLEKSTYISLGTFVGYATSGGNPWLMMISIPGGIIVMGAAIGVSRGLMNGLHRVVEGLVSGSELKKDSRTRRRIRRKTED